MKHALLRIMILALVCTQAMNCSTVPYTNPGRVLDLREEIGARVEVSTVVGEKIRGALRDWDETNLVLDQDGVIYLIPLDVVLKVELIDEGSLEREGDPVIAFLIIVTAVVLASSLMN